MCMSLRCRSRSRHDHEEREDVKGTDPSEKIQDKSKDESGNMLEISATANNLTKAPKN